MTLVNPSDTLERQNEKLLQISLALMRRVEQDTGQSGVAYAQFERAALLEDQVRQRTLQLEQALDLLRLSNTRLAQANRETEAARSDLADAIETVREGFALFDPEDRLVLCNSRFCRDLLDIGDELTPGLSFAQYVTLVSESRFLALPEGETAESWAQKRMRRHRDSSVLFNVSLVQNRWMQVGEHRTANGGTVILQTDVTELVRLERQEHAKLRDRQARMIRATLDHLDQGVLIFDRDAQLVGWNQRAGDLLKLPLTRLRLGAGFDTLLAELDTDLEFSDGLSADALRDWSLLPNGRRALQFEARRTSGRALAVFAQEMPDSGFVFSFTDVTAEREAREALREANERLEQRVTERTAELADALEAAERANASKSRFVAAASHDLLQPLSAAKLFVASLAGKSLAPEDRSLIDKTENALDSVEQIIEALLDISRLESGRAQFDVGPVALRDIFAPLRQQLEPVARAAGIGLRFVDTDAVVLSDAAYLRRIVQNLVSNAVRYTRTGKVLVGVRRRRGEARIEVWDTGVGIPPESREVIFEEFQRLNARASASEGLGLGLAIVRRACAQLGHALALRSEPGRGSGFFVTLPISRARSPARARPDAPVLSRRLRDLALMVFLVENDNDLRRAISLNLESWGLHVIDAPDAATALQLLEDVQIRPDAMLLDYQLGDGLSGTDLLSVLRARYGDIPTRIISASRSPQLRAECDALGVELMTKPLDSRRLRGFLDEVAERFAEGA